MLFDGDGNRMTPTHATKEGKRYRYYISRPLITSDQIDGSAGLRIPAGEIEQAVTVRCGALCRQYNQRGSGHVGYIAGLVLAGCGFNQSRGRHLYQARRASNDPPLLDPDPTKGPRGIVCPRRRRASRDERVAEAV